MLLLIAVLAVLFTAVVAILIVRRQDQNLFKENPTQFIDGESLRPLFAPTDEEIRAFENEERARLEAEAENERAAVEARQDAAVAEAIELWRRSPDRSSTTSLLVAAARSESSNVFSRIASEILQVFNEQGIAGISHGDLAALLDSHFRLLPQQERSAGVVFGIKQEIAELRRKPAA
jgi:hypothetical protein